MIVESVGGVMHRYFLKDFSREGENIIIERSVYIEGCLPLHGHDFLEIFYIEKGKGWHILNDTRTPIEEGDLVFLSYHSVHTLEPETENFTWINLSFYPEFIDKSLINEFNSNEIIRLSVFKSMFEDNTVTATSIKIKNAKSEFAVIFKQMEEEYQEKKYGYVQILKYDLLIVLTKIFRDMRDFSESSGVLSNNKIINSVIEELENNLSGEINLDTIAKKAYMSPKYFSRFFKQSVGITFMEFVHKQRINRACELLEQTDYSVADIMRGVGYSDGKSFYRLFKRYKGVTPNEYRKTIK